LEAQTKAAGFIPERRFAALFGPPFHSNFWLRSHGMLERVGQRLSHSGGGGVILLEVSKQVPARPRTGLAERVQRPLRILEGVAEPTPVGRSSR
jgi:hypothetical protein